MFSARRVQLAREALPAVTAWVELVIGPDRATQVASDAVVAAASASGSTTLAQVTRAARDDAAMQLARGECRVPTLSPLEEPNPSRRSVAAIRAADRQAHAQADADAGAEADAGDDAPMHDDSVFGLDYGTDTSAESSAPYLPDHDDEGHDEGADAPAHPRETGARPPRQDHAESERDRRTPAERLADALPTLRPHERLAAVRYYLDGESVESIADLFDITRDDAVKLLEHVTSVLAPIVGEHDLPDFAAEATEIDVVSR